MLNIVVFNHFRQVAQMAGWITSKRYNYATVFVDHHSGLGYLHLQKTQSAMETLQGKALFERRCAAAGIKVEHYLLEETPTGWYKVRDYTVPLTRPITR